jgi:large subunit ribosomal protein L16
MASGRLSAQVIETIRRSITRAFRRSGKVWIRVFPDISVSEKPAEVRMGKGKGSPSFWVCRIRSGQVLFEMDGVSFEQSKAATELAACKFPFAIRFVTRAQKYSAIAKL